MKTSIEQFRAKEQVAKRQAGDRMPDPVRLHATEMTRPPSPEVQTPKNRIEGLADNARNRIPESERGSQLARILGWMVRHPKATLILAGLFMATLPFSLIVLVAGAVVMAGNNKRTPR